MCRQCCVVLVKHEYEAETSFSSSDAGPSAPPMSRQSDVSSFGQLLVDLRPTQCQHRDEWQRVLQLWDQLSDRCGQADGSQRPTMQIALNELADLRSSMPSQTVVPAQPAETTPSSGPQTLSGLLYIGPCQPICKIGALSSLCVSMHISLKYICHIHATSSLSAALTDDLLHLCLAYCVVAHMQYIRNTK